MRAGDDLVHHRRQRASALTLMWKDTWTVTLGAAHQFNKQFSLAGSLTWDQGASAGLHLADRHLDGRPDGGVDAAQEPGTPPRRLGRRADRRLAEHGDACRRPAQPGRLHGVLRRRHGLCGERQGGGPLLSGGRGESAPAGGVRP